MTGFAVNGLAMTHEDVLLARARLAGLVLRTPTLECAALDRITGGRVLLKAEPLQRTGSFKLRGAGNALRSLGPEQRRAGVVTFSSGNHGQGLACAAASLGIVATVFMPADAPAAKREATSSWGATVVLYDRAGADRIALAQAHSERTGAVLVPPFDHPDVIAGQGTLALELLEDARVLGLETDVLLVPTGGGGLIAGCALAAEGVAPTLELVAVEPVGWDDTARSLAAGERVTAAGGSGLCDSLMTPQPGALTFAINRARLSGALVVTDEEVLAAMRFAMQHLRLVVEPGGAVALAALLFGRRDVRGQVAAVVLSGGNADPAVLRRALDG